jgi:hypothetical protein
MTIPFKLQGDLLLKDNSSRLEPNLNPTIRITAIIASILYYDERMWAIDFQQGRKSTLVA